VSATVAGLGIHVEIGLAALARGYLDARRMAEALAAIGAAHGGTPAEAWVRPGYLAQAELDVVLASVAPAKPRRVTRVGHRIGTPAPISDRRSVDAGAHTVIDHAVMGSRPDVPAAPPPVSPPPERYVRQALLGVGGMGEVQDVVDTVLGRRIAQKVLRPPLGSSDPAVAMLEREARVTGSLQHPNIIPVHDAGHDAELGPFYTMRLIDQPSLDHVLERLRGGDAEIAADYGQGRLLRYFVQVCQAVDYAHSRGVVHCDLKPANILLGSFGEVLVVDWGLAYVLGEDLAHRGGTPGYLAPEQMPTSGGTIDARTDVYALGAVLYEIVCLEPAFPDVTPSVIIAATDLHALAAPVPPGQRRPGAVPGELEDIVMQALAHDPAHRFASARALSEALESFLEGTRERQRRSRRAEELIAQGDQLAEDCHESLETRPDRLAELRAARGLVMPWEPAERKRALWDAEDRVAVLDALGVRTLQAAAAAYEQALDEVPGHPAARRGLARLYRNQMQRALERRDELDRVFFEELVKQYDDGGPGGAGEGLVSFTARPGPARLRLVALDERDRRLVAVKERALAATPLDAVRLAPGSYIATCEGAGGVAATVPIFVRGGQAQAIHVDLDAAADREPGEIYVPGGPALLGSDDEGRELREVVVPAFYLAERPVTFAEYLEFLAALRRDDPEQALELLARSTDGTPLWEWRGDRYEPARVGEWSGGRAELLRLPAFGVDARGALAYAAWRSTVTGRRYRLPTELEWEKAARGVDGRAYPWGDRFDASFCKMRESRPGSPAPEPSGRFADDVSPYGVRDLAGGVADWVLPSGRDRDLFEAPAQMVTRGGAWCDWHVDCRLDTRRSYQATETSSRIGFRLAR
jgi:serine/threonine-protein kinase